MISPDYIYISVHLYVEHVSKTVHVIGFTLAFVMLMAQRTCSNLDPRYIHINKVKQQMGNFNLSNVIDNGNN